MITKLTLAPYVTLRAIRTDRFKTGCFSINFVRPHRADTAAEDALLPSVLLSATEKYPNIAAVSARLDELYGATVGTLVRKRGEVKLTGIYVDFVEDAFVPEGESVFAPMLAFTEEVLFHPLTENGCFRADAIEREKLNLMNTIAVNADDKQVYAMLRLTETMCDGEDYRVPRLGTVESVARVTAQSLWEHYRRVLTTSAIEIFYAGRRTPEQAAAAFGKLFAGQRTPLSAEPFGTNVLRVPPHPLRECTETADAVQSKLILGLRTGIVASDEDYPALWLLNVVLGGGSTSKLFTNLREKRSLCYYADSSIDKFKGLMVLSCGISAERYDEAREAILGELAACKRGEISAEELENARRQLLSSLRLWRDMPAQLDEFYIAGAVGGGADDFAELTRRVTALTVEDLTAAAQKLTLDTVFFLKGEAQ